ncbi:monooxygenase [Actinomadura soli]|uniref:Monooxygenase n=1 Tax=Actinomadura soli TaxID=2508997 RepID=A0A5C4J6T4_9ACTN|nr:FAD-dependent monooxygenase [Actinomadura soli]TMQ91579.1 monooxygenase [Actinomadura soli]
MDTEVIVIGAGPVGLMLAGELRLGGVDVTVYERRAVPSGESRGLGFTARAAEVFAQRGLLERFGEAEASRQGHFGGIPMDFGILEGAHFGVRGIPQNRIEAALEEWAGELGADIKRGHELVGLRTSDDGVTAIVDGPDGRVERTAAYLVGCDGGRSVVRPLAGFDFPGTPATREMFLADVVGRDIRPRFIGERVEGGMVMAAPLEPGVDRIIVCPHGAPPPDEGREPPFAEVAAAWERLTGEPLDGAETRWVSSFTDATRQVTEYRRGRVLLAGDAAHIHLPAGGQGLSVGVQDAVNLGWKLAATVNGWAPPGLLDTYHAERHPVGDRVLRNTRAQGLLYLSGKEIEPLRTVMTELVAIPEVGRQLAGMVSGLDIRYDVGSDGHPLLGTRVPDRELELADGRRTRVAALLHNARGVLIGTAPATEPRRIAAERLADGWSDRVDVVGGRWVPGGDHGYWPAPHACLIRPDGHLVWAAPGGADLGDALRRWFGAERPMATAASGGPGPEHTFTEESDGAQHADRRPDGA